MCNDLISVIVPVYRAEKYIGRCIDSIVAQKHQNWQLIIVDDGSPDNSGLICDNYSKKDERIEVIHQKNSGASNARNTGIKRVKGKYFCFCDADDYVTPDYLSCMVSNMEDDIDLIFQGLVTVRGNKVIEKWSFACKSIFGVRTGETIFDYYNSAIFRGPYCKLYRTEIVRKNDIYFSSQIIYAEDYDMLLNYLFYCNKVKVLPECNYYYEEMEGGLSKIVNPFEKEYSSLVRIFDSSHRLMEIVSSAGFAKQQTQYLVDYINRVILSNNTHNYSIIRQTINYYSVSKRYTDFYQLHYIAPTAFLTILKYLFAHRLFFILAIMYKLSMFKNKLI